MELFGFGPHLMIDGYHAASEKLQNPVLLTEILQDLPRQIDMTVVLPPHVTEYHGLTEEDSGYTGVVIIAESHIAIHTFPKRGFVSVDIFSCKEFDAQQALNYLVDKLDIGRYDTHFINRGKEFPKDLAVAEKILSGEREYLTARLA